MKILRFMEEFPTEESFKTHFKEQREREGIICKRCQSTSHYWLGGKWQWECKACKFRTTLEAEQ